tara:strand:- start:891 stop:2069 length:1179 start_codon:yes stop_codon:yes gene_type:complete
LGNNSNPLPKVLFADPSEVPGGPQQVGVTILQNLSKTKYHLIIGSPLEDHPLAKSVSFRYSPEIYNIGRPKNIKEFLNVLIRFPLNVISLCKFIKRHNINLIHSNNEICFTSLLAAQITGTPHIIHVHGLGFSNSAFRFIFGKILDLSCDKIIAVSNAVATKLSEVGVENKKVVISYNGVDTNLFKPTKKTKYAHTEFGISKDASIIAMISALDPRKGHTLLIKAAQNVIKHDVDTHFLIVGDHPKNQTKYKNHLIKLVDELGLNDHITFTGYQNDIHKILNSIELLIQPSVTDAGPLVPLESMSCGIPVIATDVGGNPEEILHGHTGLIIPPDDPLVLSQSIVKLLQDKDLMLKMRHNARKWTKTKFDSRLLTDTIENIYDEILEQRQHVG